MKRLTRSAARRGNINAGLAETLARPFFTIFFLTQPLKLTKVFVMSKIAAPTTAELAILRVLWKSGPATVRQIHNILRVDRDIGYSTTLKMVQIMAEKGLLRKDELVRPQVFTTAVPEAKTQLQLLDELVQRAFGGSASQLVLRAAAAKRITPRELDEIKALIEHQRRK